MRELKQEEAGRGARGAEVELPSLPHSLYRALVEWFGLGGSLPLIFGHISVVGGQRPDTILLLLPHTCYELVAPSPFVFISPFIKSD